MPFWAAAKVARLTNHPRPLSLATACGVHVSTYSPNQPEANAKADADSDETTDSTVRSRLLGKAGSL